jgi:glycosyltransferase involved in cell wall biosynthesis
MNSWPLVSIVTPAFNQAEFLEATMCSVLAQDYPAIEYIVIDDGSDDDSLAVAQRVAGEHPGRVTVLTQRNSGQAHTLNRGWGAARGEIMAYLSSDDCLLPHAVSRMVSALQAQPEVSVAYCDFWLIDASGRRLRESHTEDFSVHRLVVDLVCQPGPGAFFRRRVFDQTGGWNPELRQVPDFEFWLRAHRLGPFVRVAQSLAEYRIHEGSASFRVMSVERADEIVRVVENYWSGVGADSREALRSQARALALASKNHAQSGRTGTALRCFARALQLRPALALEPGIWRKLLVGVARRTWYQLTARTRAT